MGQCSTLPTETRGASTSGGTSSGRRGEGGIFLMSSNNNSNSNHHHHNQNSNNMNDSMREQRVRLSEGGRKESLDFNVIIDNAEQSTVSRGSQKYPRKQMKPPMSPLIDPLSAVQIREPEHLSIVEESSGGPVPMDIEPQPVREDPPISLPLPPEHALRTRCYKLNLDSELVSTSASGQRHQVCLGPFSESPPYLTYSSSDDSSDGNNSVKVAIRTAQIFRGITVSRDGTILSQNARATRSNRGNKTKRGEKSRQAAKIDKAKDLVEESILSGKNEDTDDPANMVSLVTIGEYDDMKHLVRDGSRKLREADGLPDEVLLSGNRLRITPRGGASPSTATGAVKSLSSSRPDVPTSSSNLNLGTSSPRRRASLSSSTIGSQRNTSIVQPVTPEKGVGSTSATGILPQSAPPKLKSHPRDTRSGRKEERTGIRMRLDTCNDFMDTRRMGGGLGGGGGGLGGAGGDEADWSHAWNIWNCGGAGTVSPLQPSSPKDPQQQQQSSNNHKMMYEVRDATYGSSAREVTATGRAD